MSDDKLKDGVEHMLRVLKPFAEAGRSWYPDQDDKVKLFYTDQHSLTLGDLREATKLHDKLAAWAKLGG
jgi:hypothetical protein